MIEQQIVALLTPLFGEAVYPLRAPANAPLPHAVYQVISDLPVASLKGRSGLNHYRVQISAWAKTYGAAVSASADAMDALERGQLRPVFTVHGDDIDDDTGHYRRIFDLSFRA
ncbi:DUF3168 domain-containing protein [Silvimonas soli]|uniref:DUF3168 domain-containing protein n=1 Tax=Silvimonas soli TaxID=2980100 RepID=UPI0024B37CB9|nr:DUF3168 domain-containing protein [Silvimonas soli]